MTQVAEIKSPHEQRLEDNIAGKEDIYRESHKRVFKLLEHALVGFAIDVF